jgi:hypothetical protein
MNFIFNDDEFKNVEFYANTWRQALYYLRDVFRIQGRLRITQDLYGRTRFYKLDNSDYGFSLKVK